MRLENTGRKYPAGIFICAGSYPCGEVIKMDSAQREVMAVLIRRLCSLGLISQSTCRRAEELAFSRGGFPSFFVCNTGAGGEEDADAGTQDPR